MRSLPSGAVNSPSEPMANVQNDRLLQVPGALARSAFQTPHFEPHENPSLYFDLSTMSSRLPCFGRYLPHLWRMSHGTLVRGGVMVMVIVGVTCKPRRMGKRRNLCPDTKQSSRLGTFSISPA